VPVVLRDLPVLREVFGGTARFADGPETLADALAGALSETPPPAAVAERERERALAGVALARRHTWSAAAEAHLRLYRERPGGC
jgi:hypothetical protein